MDPDVRMTKCCDGECGYRVEAHGNSPKQQEGVEVHSIAGESENAFPYQRHVAVSWIEMVGAGSPSHSEVSLHAVHGVESEQSEDHGDDRLRENLELETTAVYPSQCKQRYESATK